MTVYSHRDETLIPVVCSMASTIESLKRSGASRAPKFVRFNTPEFQDICSVPSVARAVDLDKYLGVSLNRPGR